VSDARQTWWGWHQLSDDWVRRLVRRAGISPGDLVLDIGAGTGAITHRLVAAGARVVAVELHPGRAHELRRRFAHADVRVVQADAADLRLPRQPFRIVANLPFATTTSVLRRVLDPRRPLVRAELIVPRHVAARWSSERGRDARRWAPMFDVATTARVPRSAFRPAPPSDAALLTIVRRRGPVTSPSPHPAVRRR